MNQKLKTRKRKYHMWSDDIETIIDNLKQEIKLRENNQKELEEEKNRLEKLLEEQACELNKINKENVLVKNAFLNNLSHEIRTPLNGILGFLQLLLNSNNDLVTKRMYADIINNSSQQLLDIMNDIIDLSKVESGELIENIKDIDLNEELKDLCSHYERIANKKSVEFINKCDHQTESFKINIDLYKLRVILNKLLDNAFKFTHEGYIETGFHLLKSNNVLQFYVKDTGIGIAKNKHDFIFGKFCQVELSSTRRYGGTGIGLTIAKAYAESLGGKIWLESEENAGSVFYFSMPFKDRFSDDSKNDFNSNNLKTPDLIWQDKNILIVDDLDMNLILIEKLLAKTGVKCMKAFNGREAIELIKNNDKIDLILMDLRMPVMNGIEAAREIKKIRKDINIIAQSAYIDSETKKEILTLGFDNHIEKPIESDELLSLIDAYFQSK